MSTEFIDSPAYERDLSDRLIEADPEAIATFLARAHASVYATAAGLTTDPAQRREWTHAVLTGLLDDLRAGRFEWRHGGSFWFWSRKRGWFRLLDLYCHAERAAAGHEPSALERIRERTGGDDPDAEFARVDERSLLDECLARLVHEHHRRALSLLLLDEASYPDIAQRMGVPLTTIHRWVRRARLLVREDLAERLGLRSRASGSLTDEAHRDLQRLVLVSEDLHDSELATADAHRADCAVCYELLSRVRRIESGARLAGELPPFEGSASQVSGDPEAARSLEKLMKRPELKGPLPVIEPLAPTDLSPSPVRRWLLWVPAAALVAVIVVALWPHPATDSVLRAGTRVVHAGSVDASDRREFATGDPFAIELELARPSRVIVAQLHSDGSFTFLIPDSGMLAPVLQAGRQRIGESGNPRWTFRGPPGDDAFVVVAVEGFGADVEELRQELSKVRGTPPATRVAALRKRLTQHWGPVQVVEVNRGR